jgi:small-conductance mechanosensitive channel
MDLTPEERQRIYQEERVRAQARNPTSPKLKIGFLKGFLLVFIGVVVIFMILTIIGQQSGKIH